MAKRDSKGRYKRKGMGTIITVRRGMGSIPGGAMGAAIIPPAVGGLAAVLTALAIRHLVDPTQGAAQRVLVRWAPVFGGLSGIVASLALLMLGGSAAALSSFVAALGVTLFGVGQDMILQTNPAGTLTALAPASDATAVAGYRRRGHGAIVPEYARRGTGALVLEPVGPSGHRAGTLGRLGAGARGVGANYGERVTIAGFGGLNVGAFGTPGFRP